MKHTNKWIAALLTLAFSVQMASAAFALNPIEPIAETTVTESVVDSDNNAADSEVITPEDGETLPVGDTTPPETSEDPGDDSDIPIESAEGPAAEDDEEMAEVDESYDRYVALGADLTDSERSAVLNLLGVTEGELKSDYIVNTITNDDEYAYLSDYLSSSVIGSRALSSVKVIKTEEGTGIRVSTHNINYCTPTMYTNALATAGIADADVTVAGPFVISGTSALVGVMQAYEKMTGQTLSEENKDAAINELVLTGELGESLGDTEAVSGMIAELKQRIANGDLQTEQQISDAIDEVAKNFGLSITDDERAAIMSLLKKFASLDWDLNTLINQAHSIYDKLEAMGIDTQSWFDKIVAFIQRLLDLFQKG